MYLYYEKYGMQQAVEIELLSRGCVEYSSSARTAHITLDVESSISPACCIIYYQ